MEQLGNSVNIGGEYTGSSFNYAIKENAVSDYILKGNIMKIYREYLSNDVNALELGKKIGIRKSLFRYADLVREELELRLDAQTDKMNNEHLTTCMEKIEEGDYSFVYNKLKNFRID